MRFDFLLFCGIGALQALLTGAATAQPTTIVMEESPCIQHDNLFQTELCRFLTDAGEPKELDRTAKFALRLVSQQPFTPAAVSTIEIASPTSGTLRLKYLDTSGFKTKRIPLTPSEIRIVFKYLEKSGFWDIQSTDERTDCRPGAVAFVEVRQASKYHYAIGCGERSVSHRITGVELLSGLVHELVTNHPEVH